jgi:tetratricopeptide (TPR) repeat protein
MAMLMTAVMLVFDTDWREISPDARRVLLARSTTVAHVPVARAIPLFEEGLAILREAGDVSNLSGALSFFGVVAYELGDEERGAALLEEVLTLSRQAGDRWNEGRALQALEDLAFTQGDYARAAELHAESLAAFQALGDASYIALTMLRQAYLLWAQGDPAGAATRCREGLELAHRIGYFAGIAEGLEALAIMLCDLEQTECAARVLGAAESVRASMGAGMGRSARPTRLTLIDRAMATLRARLGDDAFASAFESGRALSLDEAVAEALESPR